MRVRNDDGCEGEIIAAVKVTEEGSPVLVTLEGMLASATARSEHVHIGDRLPRAFDWSVYVLHHNLACVLNDWLVKGNAAVFEIVTDAAGAIGALIGHLTMNAAASALFAAPGDTLVCVKSHGRLHSSGGGRTWHTRVWVNPEVVDVVALENELVGVGWAKAAPCPQVSRAQLDTKVDQWVEELGEPGREEEKRAYLASPSPFAPANKAGLASGASPLPVSDSIGRQARA